jgi:4,5-DOPA dioxygenase extradiol
METVQSTRMPALFVGHGSPMNAIEDNVWSRAFQSLATDLPTPQAILCISAHWYGRGTRVTGDRLPKTIHDFGGFPKELFQVEYPAPGDPALANRIVTGLEQYGAQVSLDWGLDHGAWSVLRHLRPAADIPVLQLSIDQSLTPGGILEIGKALDDLREEGVLVFGSGNITHNLRDAMGRWDQVNPATPDWAARFDRDAAEAMVQHDAGFLADLTATPEFRLAHPTPDHYLPLLYIMGAINARDSVSFPITGFDLGSLSMRAALFT